MRPKAMQLACIPLAICVLLALSGCPQQGDDTPDSSMRAASAANAPAVNAAVDEAARLLGQGSAKDAILTALVNTLSSDARVLQSDVDEAEGVVWADFVDGETHCFLVIDEASDSAGTLDSTAPASALPRSSPRRGARPEKADARRQPFIPGGGYAQPDSNRALLVNSLDLFHSNWDIRDSTELIAKMLLARGYTIVRGDLTLDDFSRLTDYGVILIEAHGQWRDPEYLPELLQLPPEVGIPNTGTCGGAYSRMCLLTTTAVTAENIETHRRDVWCGRLTLWNVTIRQPNGQITKRQYYGVTPNYVREHVSEKFPNNTLFILNACRAYADDLSSPFRDMLFEKCDEGATFLGWTNKVWYAKAARAVLYLFQLMTASNEEKIVKNTTVLQKFEPPQGGHFTSLDWAMWQLEQRLYQTDTGTGAQLVQSIQDNTLVSPILMPHPRGWEEAVDDGEIWLRLVSDTQPTVTIGGRTVTASAIANSSAWTLSGVLPADYGDIIATRGGITSIARPLRRWRPSITVEGNANGLQYNVTFTLLTRATVNDNALRDSVWNDPPPAVFDDSEWLPEASFVAWTVSGQRVTPDYRYVYDGSGSRAFGHNDWGEIECSDDGQSVSISVHGLITYTTTTTDLSNGNTSTRNDDKAISVSRQGVPLGSNWSIAAESFQQNVGFSGQANVRWNAIVAEPPFDPNGEPR